jgi:transcriptional regulator with XRE-family HTH domain
MDDITKDVEKLKEIYKAKNYKELASALNISKSAIDGWVRKKKLPSKYKLIIEYNFGENNNINVGGINHGIMNINNIKSDLCKVIEQLEPKRAEYYYHKIKAELLEDN